MTHHFLGVHPSPFERMASMKVTRAAVSLERHAVAGDYESIARFLLTVYMRIGTIPIDRR